MSFPQAKHDTGHLIREILNRSASQPVRMVEAKACIRDRYPDIDESYLEQVIIDHATLFGRAVEF